MSDGQIATVVTKREDTMPQSVTATTPGTSADVVVVAMPAWQIALVRTARVYVQSLLGILTANATGLTDAALGVDAPLYTFWAKFVAAATISVAPAAFTLLQNVVELLAQLDTKRPTLRA